MAQHDDARSSAPADDHLRSLYRQRKRNNPVPDHLNEAVLKAAEAGKQGKPGFSGWKTAIPSVAAAMVVVVLGLNWLEDPKPMLRDEVSLKTTATTESDATDAASPIDYGELEDYEMAEEEGSSIAAPAPQFEPKPSAPAENRLSRSQEPIAGMQLQADQAAESRTAPVVINSEVMEPEAMKPEAMSPEARPRYLKARAAENEGFEGCEGKEYDYDIPSAPKLGWFEVVWSAEGQVSEITPLGAESPCPAP